MIVFHDLVSDEIESIVDLLIARLRDQLLAQGVGIKIAPAARALLARSGFDPAFGARPLRRAIQRLVEDPLSEQLLAGEWMPGDVVLVDTEDGHLVFHKGSAEDDAGPKVPVAVAPKATMLDRSSRSRLGTGAADGAAGA